MSACFLLDRKLRRISYKVKKALRVDAHSREEEICRKRPRSARECAKAHSFSLSGERIRRDLSAGYSGRKRQTQNIQRKNRGAFSERQEHLSKKYLASHRHRWQTSRRENEVDDGEQREELVEFPGETENPGVAGNNRWQFS